MDVGYHHVIRRNGEIEAGRPLMQPGAHALGHNSNSVAVCLAGGVAEDGKTPEDNFTVPQWDALSRITGEWLAVWPQLILCGHRDLGANKACPSFSVSEWLTVHFSQPFSEANSAALAKYLFNYRKDRDK
jgi:N-acetylmuramoyl-L-alanine amidase